MHPSLPLHPAQNLPSQLMDFRTIYLRAVARASVDLPFRKLLTNPRVNPLKTLEEYFGYRCPWDLTLVLQDSSERGPRVNVANGTVMTQPFIGESILIYIPDRPKTPGGHDVPPEILMDALAAYYNMTPFLIPEREPLETISLPGRATDSAEPSRHYEPTEVPSPERFSRWTSVDMLRDANKRFDLGVAIDDFVSFAAAMFNAVALAWNNKHFKTLLTDPQSSDPAIGLLQTWIGFKYPWMLNLQIRIDPTAKFEFAGQGRTQGTWQIKPPQLTLTLPWMTGASDAKTETELNTADTHVAIMGVTLYNSDGPGYPFTCG